MTRYVIDKKIIKLLSISIWTIGLLCFLAISFSYLLGAFDFVFKFLASLVSDTVPSTRSSQNAKLAFSNLFPIMVFCLLGQFILFALPSFLTGSREAITYYNSREEHYIKALSGRIDLAKQITTASEHLERLETNILSCQAMLTHLKRDTKVLCEAVDTTRESLPASYRKKAPEDDKGDF